MRIQRSGSDVDRARVEDGEDTLRSAQRGNADLRQPLVNRDDEDEDEEDAEWDPEAPAPMTPFTRSPVMFFRERFQAGSIKGSVFTLVVAIVGAGTLSVPFAIERSGLVLGTGLFIVGSMMAFFSLQLLVISSELSGIKSYPGIARHLYGNWAYQLAQWSLLLNLYGTSISYIVASGTMIAKVLQVVFGKTDEKEVPYLLEGQFVMILSTCIIVIPLCLLRTMGALRYSSLIGVACSIYLTIVVLIKYFTYCADEEFVTIGNSTEQVQCFWKERTDQQQPIELAHLNVDRMLSAIPIVVYAYTCHPNVLPIFMELQKPTRRRMYKVVGRAIGLACFLYLVLGIFGYLTFKGQLALSDGNFLNNDYHHDTATLLGAIGMSFSVILAIPLFVNAFRANIYRIYAGERANPKDAPLAIHVAMSVGMVGLALLPAILIKDISKVFQVLGSTTNPIICFVLPAMFIVRAAPSNMYRSEKILSVFIAVTISIVSLISLVRNVQQWGATKESPKLDAGLTFSQSWF